MDDNEPDAETDPDSQKALLDKKEKRELRKINAAREKSHKRLDALLSIGSESEDVSEKATTAPKKRHRTRTADGVQMKLKRSPSKTKRSKSEEDLLSAQDDENAVGPSDVFNVKKPNRKKKEGGSLADVVSKTSKKKKKQKPTKSGSENEGFEDEEENIEKEDDDDDDIPEHTSTVGETNVPGRSAESLVEDGGQLHTETGKKRRRKKKKSLNAYIEQALEKKRHDDGLLLCILVHKADQVRPDARVRHPLICVHLVNMETGEYIKKTEKTRNATAMFETKNETDNIDYILPLLTQPYDFKKNRTLSPRWEETLLYNEIYSYFLQREAQDPPVIVFFELLDFVQMNVKRREFAKTDKGWYRIAWAFLKVLSPSGSTNTDRQVRLQLYEPLARGRTQRDNTTLEIYRWWKFGHRVKYPSTLYVTLKGVSPPERLQPTTRSMFPTQQERGIVSYEELNSTIEENAGTSEHDQTPPMWTKLSGQANKIPNQLYLRLPSGRKGCSVVHFSRDGRYLACACASNENYPVLIYEFPGGKHVCSFDSHLGIIYDLCWSNNGKELLTASADSTVRCWDTKRFASTPIKLFSHPSFVYVCRYHVQLQSIVVTGGYDHVIRIWNKVSDTMQALLMRELRDHEGFVNSITFSTNGSQFYSADSAGMILEWSSPSEKKKKVDVGEVVNRWQLVNTIKLAELKNTILNTIQMHPGDQKLLVHSRDSFLRMLDLRTKAIIKTYTGGMNFKEFIHSSFSTCGSFVFCGTEYGLVHVWSTETGALLHTYRELEFTKAVSSIHFHPQDNYVVFSSYGDGHPVAIYSYDPKVNTVESKEIIEHKTLEQRSALSSLENTSESFRNLYTASKIRHDEETLSAINDKLMSVTAQSTKNRVTFKDMTRSEAMLEPDQTSLSTWGSDFTYTMQGSPSLLQSKEQSSSTKIYENMSSTPLKPRDRDGGPLTLAHLEVSTRQKHTDKKRKESNSSTKMKKVVAMYDFHPTEPNQLTFSANDVITVISKSSNDDWWFGELRNGRQGYFPITYVTQSEYYEDERSNARSSKSEGNMSTNYSAATDRHGNLKIISGNEDSDTATEQLRIQKKRKSRRDRPHQSTDNPTV